MVDVKRTPISNDSDEDVLIRELVKSVNAKSKSGGTMVVGKGGFYETAPYFITTGIPQLDYAVGGPFHPGFPGGRIIEIYGAEASGKSTLGIWLAHCMINQLNTFVAYQDAEYVLTDEIVEGTGLNLNKVIQSNPETLEEVFEGQENFIDDFAKIKGGHAPVGIFFDSVAACSTNKEIEGEVGTAVVGEHARLMSQALRRLVGKLSKEKVLSVYINQVRDKIGGNSWGDNTTTFGGRSLKYYSSIRIRLSKIGNIKGKDGGDPVGATIDFQVTKNKVAPPLRKGQFNLMFETRDSMSFPKIDTTTAIIEWLIDNDLLKYSGGRVEIEGQKLYKSQAKELLEEDAELMAKYMELAYSVKE